MQDQHHNDSNKNGIARRLMLAQAELLIAEVECEKWEEMLEAAIERYNRLELLIDELEDQLGEEPP